LSSIFALHANNNRLKHEKKLFTMTTRTWTCSHLYWSKPPCKMAMLGIGSLWVPPPVFI